MLRRILRLRRPLLAAGWLLAVAASAATEPAPRLGVLTDNYPYSFRDADGRMTGFAYELAVEIEQTMGLHFDRVEGPTAGINGAFAAGRLDAVQSYADFPERRRQAAFSVPYLTMSGAIVARRGENAIHRFADLRGRRVLVHRGSLGETLLRRAGLGDSVVYAESVEQALIGVDRGDGDATLVTRLSGLSEAHRLGLRNLRALDVPVEGYSVRYCFAVRPGDHELLAQINEGLATLVRTGRFGRLYEKWFGRIDPSGYSAEQVMLAVAIGLALALAVTFWAMVRQRALRRRITQQAEDLRLGEERYRGLFEGARDGLLVLNLDGAEPVVAQINPAARRLLGLAADRAGDIALHDLLPDDPSLAAQIRSSTDAGRSGEFEHNRGDAGWVRVVVSPLGPRTLVNLADITEAVRVREQLRLQEEQLRQKQKLEAIGTLAGGVAHDFNNLLTAILGNTELALLGLPADGVEAAELRQVMLAGRRARDLVRQILTFSRRSEPRREVLALAPLIHETIDLLRTLAKGMVDFEVHVPADLPAVLADPAQVHQVLMNIGANAVQAMRGARGRLSFHADTLRAGEELQEQHAQLHPGCYVRLGLQDTGPGMTPELQRRIFEPFFTTKAPGEGTGLGLSVVHGIMAQHGGAVTLYSQPGRGTLFHLYFPVLEGPAPAPAADAAPSPATGGGERVLLVDDDPAIIETARKILEQLRYRVTTHTRADAAWTEWSAAPDAFAAIVSDLTMPGMNGLQFLNQVRATRPEQPFLLVSGFFSDAEAAEAAARQVSALLPKPLSYAALGRAVAAILRRGPA